MTRNTVGGRSESPVGYVREALAGLLISAVLTGGLACAAPGGELDAAFGEHGRLTIQVGVSGGTALSQQAGDGKLLIAGGLERADGSLDFALLRTGPDGLLDGSFGREGVATVDFGGYDYATEVAVQSDGKIVVAGETHTSDRGSDLAIARLHPDGTVDATFGDHGRVRLDLGGDYENVRGLLLLQDGRFVITGVSNASGNADVLFARFEGDGSLDTTFGTGPIVGTTLIDAAATAYSNRPHDEPLWLTGQPDGKYLACGFADTDYWDYFGTVLAVRLNPDGSPDEGFGVRGISLGEVGALAQACVVMPDGTVMLAGYRDRDFALYRLTADGESDETFGNSGVSTIDFGGVESVHAILVLDDGSLGIAGSSATVRENVFGIPTDMFVARVDASSGLPDPGFGDHGVTFIDFGHGAETAWSSGEALIQQADGKLIVLGHTGGAGIALARVDPYGAGSAGIAGFIETSATVTEAIGELELHVRRTGGSTGDLSVEYNTVAGTAVTPGDFTPSFGTLDWENGDTAPRIVRVPITEDGAEESDEAFTIVLSGSSGGLSASEFLVTVRSQSAPPPPPPPAAPPVQPPANAADGKGGAVGVRGLIALAMCCVFLRVGRRPSLDKQPAMA